jgi:hypothetical protein
MKISSAEIASAEREHELKLKLEAAMTSDVRKWFAKIQKQFLMKGKAGGRLYVNTFAPDLQKILESNITDIIEAFDGSVRIAQEKKAAAIAVNVGTDVFYRLTIVNWKKLRIKLSTDYIVDTTQRNLDKAFDKATQILIDTGEQFTRSDATISATRLVTKLFEARAATIALTETQAAAETSKLLQAQAASGLEPDLSRYIGKPNLSKTTKVWITMGDDRVRRPPSSEFNHVAAHGQEQNLNEPYIVSNEKLMQPSDMSLGASAGNVYGCRCSSQYRVHI